MRSLSLRILANNEAGTWASWPEKIAAIKEFYAPACELNITLTPTMLTPQFVPYSPTSGSGTVYRVDENWYEQNVNPLAAGADLIMFVVPPSDHPTIITLMGLDVFQPGKSGEMTVFSDETSHTYVTEIDQGETAVVYAKHELSHAFYGLLAKADNTHLYFYAGTPEKVLADFDFDEQELAWYQQIAQDLEQELGLIRARQIAPQADTAPESQNSAPPPVPDQTPTEVLFPPKITLWASIITKEEGANPLLNNPGNLKYSTLTATWNAVPGPKASDGGTLCKFSTLAEGQEALCNFLVLGCQDELLAFHSSEARTLAGFTKIYAGNPRQGYVDAIVQAMGGDANVQISTFLT
jgi:hypothetical protein